ncbi:serine/threonine-protein kinase [Mariniblastus fucicola]|uniref:Serine/threonine-protein kinase PrkC n=1 Tax=Mariniblastus fucicola TaxID=980251 RepID=A0A5B9PJE0_9BACT|nr:serine/threonine-protein kinase [Mariniblastus fucicola]QEG24802.1 Serine/threonine-protein kinase PrkC [Mariniblastus fucicola]
MASAQMDVVHELVDRWENEIETRKKLTLRELCIDHPELTTQVTEMITALEWVKQRQNDFFGVGDFDSAKRLGRFEIREIIGAGTFGTVWLAFDPHLQRDVAIKVQNCPDTNIDFELDPFLKEARLLSKLRHEHIVQVYEVGRDGETVYFVTELIEGYTLAEYADGRPLTFGACIDILRRVANALDFAHEQGYVHRDVKPSNILIGLDGRVAVCDFGIAESQSLSSGYSGTELYMSPEQAAGDRVDSSSDIYSLGVVASKLLSGGLKPREHLPKRQLQLALSKIAKTERSVIKRATAFESTDRHSTATEFVISLATARQKKRVTYTVLTVALLLFSYIAFPWNAAERYLHSIVNADPLYSIQFQGTPPKMTDHTGEGVQAYHSGHVRKCRTEEFQDEANSTIELVETDEKNPVDAGIHFEKAQLSSKRGFSVTFWFQSRRLDNRSRSTLVHLGESSGYGESAAPQLTVWLDEQDEMNILSFHRFGHVAINKPELNENMALSHELGGWTHFALTYDPSEDKPDYVGNLAISLNGEAIFSRGNIHLGNVLRHSKTRLSLGTTHKQSRTGMSHGLVGEMSKIQLWDRCLYASEIRGLAKKP